MRLRIVLVLLMISPALHAQKYSVSTDILDYAALGTLNIDGSYAFSRHFSAVAGARYNPFTYHQGNPENQFQSRQLSFAAGVRYWPWHTWSGWWFAAKLRYQEYNVGGIMSPETNEGDRFGAGLYSGYTYMLSSHFNLEFGLGMWTGLDVYKVYSCPTCGLTIDGGRKAFLLPDDLMLSLVYVF